MNISTAIAIAAIIISIASTLIVFFERAAINRRLLQVENRIAAIGTSLTR